jgi:hypothetical protein
MSNDFSNWTKKDFERWLHANYPAPDSALKKAPWVAELYYSLPEDHDGSGVRTYRTEVGYEACLSSFAETLAEYNHYGSPSRRWVISIYPGKSPSWDKRRRKK